MRIQTMRVFGWLGRAALVAGFAVACAGRLPAAADTPSYASGQSETIKGTIYQLTGKYTLTLQDERGFNDSVTLHDGSIITPTGLALAAGQVATIAGHTDGKTFDADEVDVDPATISSDQAMLPAPDYTPAYGYGYGAYGYPPYAFAFGLPGDAYYGYNGYYGGYPPGYGYYGPGYYGPGYNQPQPSYGNGSGHAPASPGRFPLPPVARPLPGHYGAVPGRAQSPIYYHGFPPVSRANPPSSRGAAPTFHAPAAAPHMTAPQPPPQSSGRR